MNTPLFRGTATALVTPFNEEGAFDEPAFRRLIQFQLEAGIDALVVLGTTGENPTITDDERACIVDVAVRTVAGAVPVVVGTGTNDTAQSVRFSSQASVAGADGLLVVGPYYNKPSQSGFSAHVQAIASATDCPIILYNVPGRTGFRAEADTVLRLATDIPSVVGIKEASGDLGHISTILSEAPADFVVYSGDDELTQPVLALGAAGVISVVSNVVPNRFRQLVTAGLSGDFVTARQIHFELLPLMRACFSATNPVPVKAMLASLDLISEYVRLPLVPLENAERIHVLQTLRRMTAVQAA